MGNNPEEETSYTTQHQDAFLKYVGNEYCTKPRHLPVITPQSIINNNLFPSAIASRSSQSSHDPYDVPSHDEEYIMPNDMVKTTPEWSDGAACSVIAARLNSNLPTESPHNWGQSNVNLNDYHSHPIEISSIFWIPDITDWWHPWVEMHSQYGDLPNVARDLFSIIPHHIAVEASSSCGRGVISWRQLNTRWETLSNNVIVKQFARPNNGILGRDDLALHITNSENDLKM